MRVRHGLVKALLAVSLGVGLPGTLSRDAAAALPAKLTLTWFGQACFLIETAAGTRVVTDPIPKGIGYELPAGLRAGSDRAGVARAPRMIGST